MGYPPHTLPAQAALLLRFRIQENTSQGQESQICCEAACDIGEVPTVQTEGKTEVQGQQLNIGNRTVHRTNTMRSILTVRSQLEVGFIVPVPWTAAPAVGCLKNTT